MNTPLVPPLQPWDDPATWTEATWIERLAAYSRRQPTEPTDGMIHRLVEAINADLVSLTEDGSVLPRERGVEQAVTWQMEQQFKED
jgi:hypothetical protein